MARMHKWLGLAALAFSLTGCVSAEQYNAMKLSRDQAVEQLNQAEADAQSAASQSDAYKAQLEQIANSGNTKDGMLCELFPAGGGTAGAERGDHAEI